MKDNLKKFSQKGFTLIELMIVIKLAKAGKIKVAAWLSVYISKAGFYFPDIRKSLSVATTKENFARSLDISNNRKKDFFAFFVIESMSDSKQDISLKRGDAIAKILFNTNQLLEL